LLRPKPDFEKFVALILKAKGYEIDCNRIVPGKCIEHEVDIIARKGKETIYVEVKHHFNHHTYTGLDVFLEANSAFEDLREGYELGKNKINFTQALVVCNTKISEHARKYAECKGIKYIVWKHPKGNSLEELIEKYNLYPITFLKTLERETEERLGDNGIVLIKQLAEADVDRLSRRCKVPKEKLTILVKQAREILIR